MSRSWPAPLKMQMKRIWFSLVREIFRRSMRCWFNYGNLVTTFISSRQPKWLFSGRVISFVIGSVLDSSGLTRHTEHAGRSGWPTLRRLAIDNLERIRTENKNRVFRCLWHQRSEYTIFVPLYFTLCYQMLTLWAMISALIFLSSHCCKLIPRAYLLPFPWKKRVPGNQLSYCWSLTPK